LLQLETAPVLVSSLIMPSAAGDKVKRPFSVSGIDCAAAALIPRQTSVAAAMARNCKSDLEPLMDSLRPESISYQNPFLDV
jgi:hypothetical protein